MSNVQIKWKNEERILTLFFIPAESTAQKNSSAPMLTLNSQSPAWAEHRYEAVLF